ncbi:MAG: YtxH domain-containing protein [Burkholderiales bacterium]|nr:YtxH domain-containing protein [Bacteroidia bacterium]
MGDKTKIMGALVLGAIAGAAIVKLLDTEKGKEFIESAKEKAQSTADNIKARINSLESELAELLNGEKESNTDNHA